MDDTGTQTLNHLPIPRQEVAASTRWMEWGGWLLIGSGLVHLIIYATQDGSWEGPVSWRKPILFGLSTGMTMLSMAWIWPRLKPARYDGWLIPTISFGLVFEVALITVQQWRGVASHFNHETLLDQTFDLIITVFVTLAALAIFDLTRRSWRSFDATPDIRLAVRWGMNFLSVSCLIGFWMLWFGGRQMAAGNDPGLVGNAGVAKFPHGVTIHSIQFLPLLCWILWRFGFEDSTRRSAVAWVIGSMALLLLFSIMQTAAGRSRFDLTLSSGLVLAAGMALLVPVGITVLRQVFAKQAAQTS
ncbi:MAG: hypothetical protein AAFN77_11180 [Planctomycetota bacterium]